MTSILINGAAGFIASHLIPKLRSTGHDVIAVGRDAGDIALASTWARFPKVDVVVHLAGKSFVPHSWIDPVAFFACNVVGTTCALEYCRKHGTRLIFLSSYMYGNPESLPIPESAPLVANNPYALSKKMAEEACRFFAERFNVDVSVLRLFNVYGPEQGADFLIPSVIAQAVGGGPIRVKDLEPRRDYVYVDDVVDAIIGLMASQRGFSVYNIGSATSYSVAEVIQAIQDVWKTNAVVINDAQRRADEIMDTVADITAARRGLNWQPRFSLLEGLRDMYSRAKVHAR